MRALLLLALVFIGSGTAFKISDELYRKLQTGATSEVILELDENVVFSALKSEKITMLSSRIAKRDAIVSSLKVATSSAQAELIGLLKQLGIEYESFWISNAIHLKNLSTSQAKRLLSSLQSFSNNAVSFKEVAVAHVIEDNGRETQQTPQWNLERLGAPQAWSETQGEGVVVAVMDTGVNINHVSLENNFAGAWFDPYRNTDTPDDQQGHGTHIAGTILGQTNGIGVAPGANWIACRGIADSGAGTQAALLACAQFLLSANPMPHIINNGWGGGSAATWFDSVIRAWRAAGIIPVFPAAGSRVCRTIGYPAENTEVVAVGATDQSDRVSSSRGPSSSGGLKPDFVAPGVQILSAGTGRQDYVTYSGSSMSTGHFSGAAALVLGKHPNFGFDEVYEALRETTFQGDVTDEDKACGLPNPDSDFPNYAWGWGLIQVGWLG